MTKSTTVPPRVAEIRVERAALHAQIETLNEELDTYRVKCTECRCRIIPGEACGCCADNVPIFNEEIGKTRPWPK